MSAKYSVVERKDPRNTSQEGKYYTANRSEGVITTRELAQYIAERSGVSIGQVQGIIEDFGEEMEKALLFGETCDLGSLGIMYMNLSSEGSADKEGFTTSMIKRVYIHMRTRKTFSNKLKDIKYEKVKYVSNLPKEEGV